MREIGEAAPGIRKQYESFSGEGYRVLGIACREMGDVRSVSKKDEAGMTFLGFILLFGPTQAGRCRDDPRAQPSRRSLKIITGDNRLVTELLRHDWARASAFLTGAEIHRSNAALTGDAENHIFAEIEPNQKERIILALRRRGMWSDIWATASTTFRPCTPRTWASPSTRGGCGERSRGYRSAGKRPPVLQKGVEKDGSPLRIP